jgi:hypothetical protein
MSNRRIKPLYDTDSCSRSNKIESILAEGLERINVLTVVLERSRMDKWLYVLFVINMLVRCRESSMLNNKTPANAFI